MQYAHRSEVDSYHLLPRLKRLDRWLCFQIRDDDGRMAKVPVTINEDTNTPYRVSYRNPDHWQTYHEAKEIVDSHPDVDGLQIVVNDSRDPYVIIDFDNCVDPETKAIEPAARRYLEQSNTYAEFSPSGTGFHLVFQGSVPRQGWTAKTDAVDLEVYEKYIITVTQDHLTGTPYEAKPADGVVDKIFTENNIRWRERIYQSSKRDSQLQTPGVEY